MRRTPFRTRTSSERDWQTELARRIEQQEKAQTKAKAKKAPRPDWQIAGKPWPASFMPESKFQTHCESIAGGLGWMHSHSHLPYFDTAGWPDLALLHPTKKRFMVRELKVTSEAGRVGKPTPTQWEWLRGLREAGVDADVWTWPMDEERIFTELSA